MWSKSTNNPSDMASFQPKDGLVRAAIEAKDVSTREVKTIVECDGWDFVNFQWDAEFRTQMGAVNGMGVHTLVGLKMVTRDYWISVNQFTGKVRTIKRTEEDKNYHYATFGR